MLLFVLLLAGALADNESTCRNVTLSSSLWERFYPTVWHYQGFSRADGYLTIYDPTGAIVPAQYLPAPFTSNPVALNGCIFHQYFNSQGFMVGDLFLSGLAPIPVLVSRQINNPLFRSNKVCQNFLFSLLDPSLLTEYSEITPNLYADDFQSSVYISTDAATLGRVTKNELFKIDNDGVSSWSTTNSFALGNNGATNYLQRTVYFKYTPITEAQAVALGYNPLNVLA